jgi:putative endonuclease
MPPHNIAFGRASEDAACVYITSLGMRIIQRNARAPSGEIDIIARDGDVIAFIEVKARNGRVFGPALSGVDARKRKRLRAAAADFLQIFAPRAYARFDVLAIDGSRMTLHRNAFR